MASKQYENTRLRRVEIMRRLRAGQSVTQISQDLQCDKSVVYLIKNKMKEKEDVVR